MGYLLFWGKYTTIGFPGAAFTFSGGVIFRTQLLGYTALPSNILSC
jgi:hypothetical protein